MKNLTYLPRPWGLNQQQNLTVLDSKNMYLGELVTDFTLIFGVLFVIIGAVNNLLGILVLVRRQRHKARSSYLYLIGIGIFNSTVLVTCLASRVMQYLTGVNVTQCRFFRFLDSTAKFSSSSLLIVITVENIVCLMFPNHQRTQTWLKPRKSLGVMFGLVGLLSGFSLHNFWTVAVYKNECQYDYDTYPILYGIAWVHAVIYSIFPFVFVTLSGVVILIWEKCCNPAEAYRDICRRTQDGNASQDIENQTHPQVTVITLNGISSICLFCTLPQTICYAMEADSQCPVSVVEEFILNEFIGDFLIMFNHSCFLVVYLLASQNFRPEMFALFKSTCFWKKNELLITDEDATVTDEQL